MATSAEYWLLHLHYCILASQIQLQPITYYIFVSRKLVQINMPCLQLDSIASLIASLKHLQHRSL